MRTDAVDLFAGGGGVADDDVVDVGIVAAPVAVLVVVAESYVAACAGVGRKVGDVAIPAAVGK